MELPVLMAMDTTERWNRSDTVPGESELAIEIAGTREDGSPVKQLLIGDGNPVGPNMARLRATPGIIAGLPGALQTLAGTIAAGTDRATAAEEELQYNIEHRPVYHDDTPRGLGIEGDPLSVVPGAAGGISGRAALAPDGTETVFPLPAGFIRARLSIITVNGIVREPGADYAIDAAAGTITFTEAPEAGDTVTVYYANSN
jgi:hypothetical protein